MASKAHNFILSSIVRKMRHHGFKLIYLEGAYQDVGTEKYEIPPKILNHRPDAIGERKNKSFCICEAKTQNDLSSLRTKNQIRDFLKIVAMNKDNKLIVGVPLNAKDKCQKLFRKLNLTDHKQVEIIYIPEELFPNEEII
jgi:hypothetical protein